MSGYAFHPDAFADLDEIWEYIAQDHLDAADRVLADIRSTVTLLADRHRLDIDART
jgi:plasmid stabilization system protein ParE